MGEILLPKELNQKVEGAGAIIIYDKKKTDSFKLMKKWAEFFLKGNCDKCVPCREGVYRINEMVRTRKIDCKILSDLFFVMEQTSFCPLGKGATLPFKSLCDKLQLL
jgi:NADH:ubiquinone oxidoreductase subunit F (NADH-binding)